MRYWIRELLSALPFVWVMVQIVGAFVFSLLAAAFVLGVIATFAYAMVILAAWSLTGQIWSV